MRLRDRLVLSISVAALLPVALLGLAAVEISTRRLDARVAALQARTADGLAIFVETWLSSRVRLIEQQARALPVHQLDDRGRGAFLRLVYRQVPEATAVGLIGPDGAPLGPTVWLSPSDAVGSDPALAARQRLDASEAARWIEAGRDGWVDAGGASADGAPASARSSLLLSPEPPSSGGSPTVVAVVPVAVEANGGAEGALVVALSLDDLTRRLAPAPGTVARVALLDPRGDILFGGDPIIDPGVFRPFLATPGAEGVRYERPETGGVLAAVSAVPLTGWAVVIAEPAEISAAAAADLRDRTAFVGLIAVVLSLVTGVLLSRQLAGPVIRLKDAALAVADGDLGRRVAADHAGADELGALAEAFNFMSGRLARNAREIEAQQARIEGFNADLQQRVEERTAELREAQAQVVQSARLAAAGEMGAGLAHELNNPVAGILGLTQVLRHRLGGDAEAPLLGSIEDQARRCRDIVERLRELTSADGTAEGPAGGAPVALEVATLLEAVSQLVAAPLRQRGVALRWSAPPGLQLVAVRARVQPALAQLLLCLRTAAVGGGQIDIQAEEARPGVLLTFALQAEEVRIGGDDWMASGVGFYAARQALADLDAELREPEPPRGAGHATWTVRFLT